MNARLNAGEMRRVAYRAISGARRLWWSLRGGRRVTIFRQRIDLVPETVFPLSRRYPLPSGESRSRIVGYGDFVQMHAAVRHIEECSKSPVVVDVGAHHGAYAVTLGKIVQPRGGTVLALEPNPESYAVLMENVRRNGLERTVRCECVAVGEKSNRMNLLRDGSQSRLVREGEPGASAVDVVALAPLLFSHGLHHVDLLLVDVEGAELPVLRSFPWGVVPVTMVLCELHPYAWKDHGYDAEAIQGFVRERGMRCLDMYLREHRSFAGRDYLGPTLLLQKCAEENRS